MSKWENFNTFITGQGFWTVILVASLIFVLIGTLAGTAVPALSKLKPSMFFMIALIWIAIIIAWKLVFSGASILQQKQMLPFIMAIAIIFALFYILIVYGNVNIAGLFSSVNLQQEGNTLMAVFKP